jgi:uncharacterized protein YacL
MIHAIRILFLICLLALTITFAAQQEMHRYGMGFVTTALLVPALIGLVVVLVDIFWKRKRLHLVASVFFGVLGGLLLAYVLSLIVDLGLSLFPAPAPAARPVAPTPAPTEIPDLLDRYPIVQQEEESDEQFALRKASHIKVSRALAAESLQRETRAYEARLAEYEAYIAYLRAIQLIKLVLGASAVFLCVTVVLQTKDDFRFVIPYVEFSRKTKGPRPMILDTSVIIDGRVADVAETKIFESPLIVPRFVLAELQTIADSGDKLKRNRGRRGLDVLNRLQSEAHAEIQILDPHTAEVEQAVGVDAKLVALAEQIDGQVVTNDYNLNKVAQLRGVQVLNLNDLANALKPVFLPGEQITLRIVKPGEEVGQGVGYLDDGTMVVVEDARNMIGQDVSITVTSVLQTSAGRMVFGRRETR